MDRSLNQQAARQFTAGRLVCCGLIAVGAIAVTLASVAKVQLRPGWFWTAEDRERSASQQTHFDKLYAAYVVETQRRRQAGRAAFSEEPEALQRARASLKQANEPLRIAQRRPKQIADALRIGGAISCGVGALFLLVVHRREKRARLSEPASPSDDAAAR